MDENKSKELIENLRYYAELLNADCWPAKIVRQSAFEIESLTDERDQLAKRIEHFKRMEPHWAKGYSSDGIAAQVSFGALNQLWKLLDVKDQTQAVKRINEMLKGD